MLAYRLRVAQPTLMDGPSYFGYTSNIIILYMFVYHIFMTSPLWLAACPQCIWRIIYKCLNACPCYYTALAVSGKVVIP